MGIDLAALKAKLASQRPAASTSGGSNASNNSNNSNTNSSNNNGTSNTGSATSNEVSAASAVASAAPDVPTINAPAKLGTSKTSEIEHLDFLSKMNSLAEALHKQHPTMPVLLMQIHKQLRADPELVTTLDEDAIGVIVKGLQVQTKTELVAQVIKETSSGRKKKSAAISVDMF